MNEAFASLYEGWGIFWLGNFSNDLYNNNIYMPVGLILLGSTLVWMAIYYYLIDHPSFAKWYHWLIWLLLLCTANFIVANSMSFTRLDALYAAQGKELPYYMEFSTFGFVNALWAFILGFVVSLMIKGKSVMCKRTPF